MKHFSKHWLSPFNFTMYLQLNYFRLHGNSRQDPLSLLFAKISSLRKKSFENTNKGNCSGVWNRHLLTPESTWSGTWRTWQEKLTFELMGSTHGTMCTFLDGSALTQHLPCPGEVRNLKPRLQIPRNQPHTTCVYSEGANPYCSWACVSKSTTGIKISLYYIYN